MDDKSRSEDKKEAGTHGSPPPATNSPPERTVRESDAEFRLQAAPAHGARIRMLVVVHQTDRRSQPRADRSRAQPVLVGIGRAIDFCPVRVRAERLPEVRHRDLAQLLSDSQLGVTFPGPPEPGTSVRVVDALGADRLIRES